MCIASYRQMNLRVVVFVVMVSIHFRTILDRPTVSSAIDRTGRFAEATDSFTGDPKRRITNDAEQCVSATPAGEIDHKMCSSVATLTLSESTKSCQRNISLPRPYRIGEKMELRRRMPIYRTRDSAFVIAPAFTVTPSGISPARRRRASCSR